jgi:hypothetical protein
MIVPHNHLDRETLTALIEEFVTRDGALHGHVDTPVEAMVASVLRQLERGSVVIVFDEENETASIVTKEDLAGRPAQSPANDPD